MEAPIVLERIRNLTTESGGDVKFRVRYHAKPEPEIMWYRNEVKLEKSEQIGWTYPEVSYPRFLLQALNNIRRNFNYGSS